RASVGQAALHGRVAGDDGGTRVGILAQCLRAGRQRLGQRFRGKRFGFGEGERGRPAAPVHGDRGCHQGDDDEQREHPPRTPPGGGGRGAQARGRGGLGGGGGGVIPCARSTAIVRDKP